MTDAYAGCGRRATAVAALRDSATMTHMMDHRREHPVPDQINHDDPLPDPERTGVGPPGSLLVVALAANGTVFLSSMCVMIVELLAARLVARHLGNSLYTWTSIIGVILAGISLGNYIGGRLADRFDPRRCVWGAFFLSALLCVVVLPLNGWVAGRDVMWRLDWPLRIAVHVGLVFLWPAVSLGLISPLIAKLALTDPRRTGRTMGGLFAWGAAGSIVGTFLAGYELINRFSVSTNIIAAAALLAGLGMLYAAGKPLGGAAVASTR
jgi:MFS family permease